MEKRSSNHHRQQEQVSAQVPAASPLLSLPVSDYLRNLANQTVIQSHRNDLISLIRENPGDNAPRLTYANHLDNNPLTIRDRARAELIRLQIARGDACPSPREEEILIQFHHEWMRELGHVRSVTWDRGFVTGITMAPRHFAQSGEPLTREPITHLRINLPGGSNEGGQDLQAAVQAPHFKCIEKLSFWMASPSTLREIEPFIDSPGLELREIHFEKLLGSHQELLETCSRLHYPLEQTPQRPLSLALGHIAVTCGDLR